MQIIDLDLSLLQINLPMLDEENFYTWSTMTKVHLENFLPFFYPTENVPPVSDSVLDAINEKLCLLLSGCLSLEVPEICRLTNAVER